MDMRKRQPIGVELVKRGIVTEKDIEKAFMKLDKKDLSTEDLIRKGLTILAN